MPLNNKLVLITGVNGFIGGRLAERLVEEEGVHVRGLVRYVVHNNKAKQKHEGRVSDVQLPADSKTKSLMVATDASSSSVLEIVEGDIADADVVKRAVDGCAIVVHCAAMQGARYRLADFRRVNVEGTLNLVRAAQAAKVSRFIHISTINVHGFPPPPDANADSPLREIGDFYSISKAEGEIAVTQYARDNNIPLVVIRPACTYGPRSTAWTLQPLRRVWRGAPVLIGCGEGICNAIYIDNLIDLIILTMKVDTAVGNAFIGAEGRGVTWREFYGAYARMLGIQRLNSLPRNIALGMAAVSQAFARLDGRSPFISRASVDFYSHPVVFNIDKSRELLGFSPQVTFEEGMQMTGKWLNETGQLVKIGKVNVMRQ